MRRTQSGLILFFALLWLSPSQALSKEAIYSEITHATPARPHSAPANGIVEVAFSPRAGATDLVVKAISHARQSILVAAYSFTSKSIAQALVDAHKRGIDVRVLLDKSQKSARYTSAAFLANMGVPTRIDSRHAIQHNKFMVIDGVHVETGSFNYTSAAEQRNAENVMVIWNNPRLATTYADNWLVHWEHSEPYAAKY